MNNNFIAQPREHSTLSPRAYASPIRKPLDNLASTACSVVGRRPLPTAVLQPRELRSLSLRAYALAYS